MSDNPFTALRTVGVVAANSSGYIHQILDNLEQGLVSVPLASVHDADRLARTGTAEIQQPAAGTGWLQRRFRSRGGDDPAQISFTSGTQGAPKAVLLSHGNLDDVVVRVTRAMEIDETIREYIGVPVYHSFGYGRCRIALNAGGAIYLPPAGFDLAEIRRMLETDEINAISAVPSLWRILLSARDRFGPELARVRWAEIGSQYMAAEEKAALRTLLPNARIVQHYGLTEASRTTLQRVDSEPVETLASVGCAEGAIEVRINDAGQIAIRGPHVALGILDGNDWRALGPEAWLETSDLGRIEDGRLYYEDRSDDIINCGGIKLSPDLLETAVRAALAAAGTPAGEFALVRRADAARGDGIGLITTPATEASRESLIEAITDQAAALGVNARGAIRIFEVEALPLTDTGKVQRKPLTHLLDGQPDPIDAAKGARFVDMLAQLLGKPIPLDRNFIDLKGDVLARAQLALTLERTLGAAPAGWESWSMHRLIDSVAQAGDFATLVTQRRRAPALPDGSRNRNPPGLSFRALVAEDFRTNGSSITHQGFVMLLVHRFGNWRMDVRPKLLRAPLTLLYRVANKLTQIVCGMKLDYTVKVGRRVKLEHFGGMILGAREIGNDVTIRQNTTFGIRSADDVNAKPVIGDFVEIGAGAVIVGNIIVGENSIIGANSVVSTNVVAGSVMLGVPAKLIRRNRHRNRSPLRAPALDS